MEGKNIFDLHKAILGDYKLYIDSFINIADKKIRDRVREEFNSGNLYPELATLIELAEVRKSFCFNSGSAKEFLTICWQSSKLPSTAMAVILFPLTWRKYAAYVLAA